MKHRLSLPSEQLSLTEAWNNYERTRDALAHEAEQVKKELAGGILPVNSIYDGMTEDEADEFFKRLLAETERQASLSLMATAEGIMRADAMGRIKAKSKKDAVGKALRTLKRSLGDEEWTRFPDILTTWENHVEKTKSPSSKLRRVLPYRNWLAHGRAWPLQSPQSPPDDILKITQELFSAAGLPTS